MTDPMPKIMQAAERLKSLEAILGPLRKIGFDEAKNCDKQSLVDLLYIADAFRQLVPNGELPDTCTCPVPLFAQSNDCPIHFPKTEEDFEASMLWHQHRSLDQHLRTMSAQPIDYHRMLY